MKTISIQVYTYDELTDKAKATARDWFREGSEFDGETTIEDAQTCLAFAGLTVDSVAFTGFSSQGDGACFNGSWNAANVKPSEMREHAPTDERLHAIAEGFAAIAAQFPHASFTVKHSGHYSHEYCTAFDFAICDENGDSIDTPQASEAEKALTELARDSMRWIYRQLESDYNGENEDEYVAETIRGNEYEFTAEGKRSVIL